MKKERASDKKGISLIVLVITIIVIIILAVAVILSIANNNPIENAKEARFKNDVKTMQEELELLKASNYVENNGTGYGGIELTDLKSANNYKNDFEVKDGVLYIKSDNKLTDKEKEWADELGVVRLVEKAKSKIGCYADIDGDGVADGVIYADLAVGGSGQWGNDNDGYTSFSYGKKEGTKDYYVRGSYKGTFSDDKKDLISVVEGSEGAERFYVMAFEDFSTETSKVYSWYYAASGKLSNWGSIATGFEKGKTNTQTMIEKWNAGEYGAKDAGSKPDIWGVIQDEVAKGWFVPSKEEWAAFGSNLNITKSNYSKKGLSNWYWSSSLRYNNEAWGPGMNNQNISNFGVSMSNRYVRLSATF